MKTKTITKIIDKKITEWLDSITDESLRKEAKKDLIVTGGCIASMFLKENVNDFDLYFKTKSTCLKLSKYYVNKISTIYQNNISDSVIDVVDSLNIPHKDYTEQTKDFDKWSFFVKGLNESNEDRVKIYIPHIGYFVRTIRVAKQ